MEGNVLIHSIWRVNLQSLVQQFGIFFMGVLYGQQNTVLPWWLEIRKLLYLIFGFDFFIWSNQIKHWERRHWNEVSMEVNTLVQLHFLQQTSKTFTASESYLYTSWCQNLFLVSSLSLNSDREVAHYSSCSLKKFFVRFFSPNITKNLHNEKSVILTSMYNICKFFDLIDTCSCIF